MKKIFQEKLSTMEKFFNNKLFPMHKVVGESSVQLLAKIRRKLGFGKKIKIGHGGTLDPFASGLIVVATGKSTKLLSDVSGLDKEYIAVGLLGKNSETGDPTGRVSRDLLKSGFKSGMTRDEIDSCLKN